MFQSIQKNVVWRAIPVAALVGGIAFLLTQMVLATVVTGAGLTYFLQYSASFLLGEAALLDTGISTLLIGALVHLTLSLIFALVIGIVVHRWGLLVGLLGGAVLGAAIYGINFYTMTVFFPRFFAINDWVLFTSHVVFGVVAGGVYEALDDYDQPVFGEEVTA